MPNAVVLLQVRLRKSRATVTLPNLVRRDSKFPVNHADGLTTSLTSKKIMNCERPVLAAHHTFTRSSLAHHESSSAVDL